MWNYWSPNTNYKKQLEKDKWKQRKLRNTRGGGSSFAFAFFSFWWCLCVAHLQFCHRSHQTKKTASQTRRNQIRPQISCQSWLIPSVPPPTLNAWIGQQFCVVRHLLLASPWTCFQDWQEMGRGLHLHMSSLTTNVLHPLDEYASKAM